MLPWKHGIKKSQLHEFNRLFMMAEQVLKDETCNTCGTPFWLGHSANSDIEFSFGEETCQACAWQAQEEETQRKNKEEPDRGTTQFVVASSAFEDEGGVLPGRRDWLAEREADFLKEQRKKEQARGDGS